MRDQTLGRAAYAAYCVAVDHQTHDGRPVPEWSALGIRIQEAWCVAAEAAVIQALDELREGSRALSVPDVTHRPDSPGALS